MAQALYDDKAHSVADTCKTFGISRTTFYRSIRIKPANKPESQQEGMPMLEPHGRSLCAAYAHQRGRAR